MKRHLLLALAPAALALTTVASAQVRPPPMQNAPSPEMQARHAAMMKQHMEDLKTVLRLRPDQESALQAFAATHEMGEAGRPQMPEARTMTTPERLEQMARHHAEMAAVHERHRQAIVKFYAALSPEQQKVFDALQRLHGMGGRMGAGMGGPHGGRHIMIPGGGLDGATGESRR